MNAGNKCNQQTGLLISLFISFAALLFLSTYPGTHPDTTEDYPAIHSAVNISSVINSGTDNFVFQRLINAPQVSFSYVIFNKCIVLANDTWRNIRNQSLPHLLLTGPLCIIHRYHIFINDNDEYPPLYS